VIFKLNAGEPGQKWVPFSLQDALNDINSAIAINDQNPALYSYRAEYKRDINGDYEGAIADMDHAINLDPENSNLYFQRAAYKHFTLGCQDYHQCSMLKDARCTKIVQTVCQ
jgi:tetratricopeptide (TPR) repeat protein